MLFFPLIRGKKKRQILDLNERMTTVHSLGKKYGTFAVAYILRKMTEELDDFVEEYHVSSAKISRQISALEQSSESSAGKTKVTCYECWVLKNSFPRFTTKPQSKVNPP